MGALLTWLGSLVIGLFTVIALAVAARRVLGVPVGWLRAVVLGLGVVFAGQAVMTATARRAGLLDAPAPGDGFALVAVLSLTIAWTFTLGLLGLIVLELLVPSGSLPPARRLVTGWGGRRRRVRRYARIMTIVFRHGLGRFLRIGATGDRGVSERARTARSLRRALEDGGVTFVKLGQNLATRSDLLAPEFVAELSRLHADVTPAPWPQVREAISASLGRDVGEVFAEVDPQPLAAASVGQVHRARLLDGRRVVLKVQRPAAAAQIAADLDILARLADRLARGTAWGRSLGIDALAAGFAASLAEELDYGVELANTRAVRAAMRPGEHICVPQTHPELSSSRLLVMQEVPGVPLTRASVELAALGAGRRHELAAALLGEVLHQLLVSGTFHADLHPGNVVLSPDGTVVLLDFGSVGRLDDVSRASLATLLGAVEAQDTMTATDAILALLGRPDGLDERALERELGGLMLRLGAGAGAAEAPFGDLLGLVLRHRFSVPPPVAAAFRALAGLEGTLRVLDPGLDLVAEARDQAKGLLGERLTPEHLRTALERQAAALPLLQRLPRRVDKLLGQAEDGRFSASVRLLADPRDRDFVTDLAQQAMLTVLSAAATIGAIMLLVSGPGPQLTGSLALFDVLGYTLLFFGVVLALRVLGGVFFGARRQRRGR